MCDALRCAHEAGIIHRDIKPANVMIEDATGAVKILDFGIAHAGETGLTNAGEMVGTLNYMAPEQISGAIVDQRTDIYAVGVLAYELLSYQRAFAGTIQEGVLVRLLHRAPQVIESVVPGIDPQLSNVVATGDGQAAVGSLRGHGTAAAGARSRANTADRLRRRHRRAGRCRRSTRDAETVAGQELPISFRARTRRGTGTGRRPVSSIGSRGVTPGTAGPNPTSAPCRRVSDGRRRGAGGDLYPLLAVDAINGLDRTAAAGG